MTPAQRDALIARARTLDIPEAGRAAILRLAHAERERLRVTGQPVPFWVRVLDSEYCKAHRKARPRPAGVLAGIRHDEAVRRTRGDRAA